MHLPKNQGFEPARSPGSVEAIIRINDELGLHARPAAKLAQTAQQFEADIKLQSADGEADAKSILEILTLAATRGTQLTLRCKGPDATEAIEAISTLFYTD